ncbi:hypothetical protein EUTSA_v10003281mg [Eutrema salsugineum]|uniref:WPP domain-containing protein n=1 Tax=Eutrema salsugineum TaxID=72664 RepID=V4LLY0_EUTSA|nr:WPP domain-containing protein 1 [Eutrema salsugineum]ESQ44754.1 hypothetical protein EUTSA_v10003281mg [Eutrema salsugineum]
MAETETISTTSTTLPATKISKEEENELEKKQGGISLRIWPLSQKTRDAVVNRLIESLSTESILSKRYEIFPSKEASSVAKSIEEEAYGVASAAVVGDDDGIEILKAYSKEISKLVLDSVKTRPLASPNPIAADAKADSTEDVKEEEEAHVDSVKVEA